MKNYQLTNDVAVNSVTGTFVVRKRKVAGERVLIGERRILADALQAPCCVVPVNE